MTLLIIVHVFVCAFLVFVILLQPGKSDAGVGFGSSSQSIFGSKGAGNFLTKTTSGCAIMFLVTSFFLTRSRVKDTKGIEIGDGPVKTQSAPAPGAPAAPGKQPAAGASSAPAAPAPVKK